MRQGTSRRVGASALAVATMLCTADLAMASPPLLDTATIRSPLAAGCAGKPDATPIPLDPRTLVVPGVNTPGAAVQFNAWWVDLHDPPEPFETTLAPNPSTCGEFRASVERGRKNIQERAYFQSFSTAKNYYEIYKQWGYLLRPADFDEQVIKRYGMIKAPFDNPYPYPWENPNFTNGGSGQLPLGLVQAKDSNGNWTGLISSSCSGCHDSRLGTSAELPFVWGRSSDANDAGLLQADFFQANKLLNLLLLAPIPWSVGRGSSDAIGIVDLLPALFDMDSLAMVPSLLEYFPTHAGGMSRAPNWWYRAFKTRQFWDGALTSDNVRSEMAFGIANLLRSAPERRALTAEFEDNDNFFLSMSPPAYPHAIDEGLAEWGAELFHERDLWEGGANPDIPVPEGNGSCASCHGVYSPQYAADPAYLPDPRLKGIAGVITPIEIIDTDPSRFELMADERKRRAWNTSFLAYNDMSPDHQGFFDDPVSSALRRIPRAAYDNGQGPVYSPLGPNEWIEPTGYMAPPLYGAWGNAPFLHNGSVPDLWGVLDPDARPAVWKRQYTAANILGTNAGYDPSFAAYDFAKLGWKYTALQCADKPGNSTFLPCSEDMATIDVLFANIANAVAQYNSLAYQSPPPITQKQIRSRMIFNSHLYGMGNHGHDFTQSLDDDERWALLEYMKTL
ncbi:rubber dioxygenase RoxA [Nannocystis bainbridge]|uniref:rubber dioxygenase RoxA n=1 Tax=Nannocystis bainbridge TaxID=2995303 RepID=UPI0040328CCD